MARDRRSSGRGGLRGLIDRLLGRDRGERETSGATALFTAHQPPPSARPEVQERPSEVGTATPAPSTIPAPEAPTAEPDPAGGDVLHTSVHEEALDHVAPRERPAPGVRVHDDHLERRSGPVELTPSQAIELARSGRDALRRRDRG